MSGNTTWEPSPTAAIGCSVLALATLPIVVHPIVVLIRENPGLRMSYRNPQHRAILGHVLVWVSIAICHLILLVHALLAANEQGCEYTQVFDGPDYGEILFFPNCIRTLLVVFVDQIEAILSPVYPVTMLRLYVQILPTARQKRLQRATKFFTLVLASISTCLCITTTLRRARFWSDDPLVLTLAAVAHMIHPRLFDVWFGMMISCALLSVGLCIKILPHLRPHSAVVSTFFKTSKVTSASAHISVSTASLPPSVSPVPSPTLQPLIQLAPPQPVQSSVSESGADSAAAVTARMRSCIWRLWACLMVILTLVVGNIVMVFGNKRIAQIVYTTVGWISCHLISVALFAATRLIKTTVLTRRLVPQSVAGTLAQSEWGGRG